MRRLYIYTYNVFFLLFSLPGVNSMSSLLEKDAGFCSGSSEHEDDHHSHDGLHSPTDASEDSVEVKFTPILKNKRKSSEPSRVLPDPDQGPLKKRFRYEESRIQKSETIANNNNNHLHRPWALAAAAAHLQQQQQQQQIQHVNPADILLRHPGVTTLHRAIIDTEQDQPLALISKKPSTSISSKKSHQHPQYHHQQHQQSQHHMMSYENSIESLIKKTQINKLQAKALDVSSMAASVTQITSPSPTLIPQAPSSEISSPPSVIMSKSKSSQRNYKNMTRERRIEANARERTRVHTISAAYDTLRKSVPSYASTQKLSKLSVLRIACSYIMTLSRLAGEDYSIDQSSPPVQDCVDAVTRTIQTEGKLRRKKDE